MVVNGNTVSSTFSPDASWLKLCSRWNVVLLMQTVCFIFCMNSESFSTVLDTHTINLVFLLISTNSHIELNSGSKVSTCLTIHIPQHDQFLFSVLSTDSPYASDCKIRSWGDDRWRTVFSCSIYFSTTYHLYMILSFNPVRGTTWSSFING